MAKYQFVHATYQEDKKFDEAEIDSIFLVKQKRGSKNESSTNRWKRSCNPCGKCQCEGS